MQQGALAAIRVNEAVLERAREIADLVSETGAYRQRLARGTGVVWFP